MPVGGGQVPAPPRAAARLNDLQLAHLRGYLEDFEGEGLIVDAAQPGLPEPGVRRRAFVTGQARADLVRRLERDLAGDAPPQGIPGLDDEQPRLLRPARDTQPVVALDFDGVINVLCQAGQEPAGCTRHDIWLAAETWPDHEWLVPVAEPGERATVVLNERHAGFIAELEAVGAHVVWASAWEHAVLPHLHLADLPERPVVPFSRLARGKRFGDAMSWKLNGFQRAFGRATPLAFVDDSAMTVRHMTVGPHGGPFKVVVPYSNRGLVRREQDALLRWVRRHADG